MKKYLLLALSLMLISLALAETYTIGTGTGTFTSHNIPFHGNFDYGWSKVIWTKQEINTAGLVGASSIIGLGLEVNNSPDNYVKEDQRIYARHTDDMDYSSGDYLAYPGLDGFQLVYQDDVIYNDSGWHVYPFSNTFQWNGNQNIEFLFENHSGARQSGHPVFRYSFPDDFGYRAVFKYANTSFPSSENGASTLFRSNVQIITSVSTPPEAPLYLRPANGIIYAPLELTFNWTSVLGAEGYKISLWSEDPAQNVEEDTDLGDVTSYTTAAPLENGRTYFWQVVPYNEYGDAEDCPVWSFTTLPTTLVTIGDGNVDNKLPINPWYGYTYSQSIYLQSELNMADQRIVRLSYYWNGESEGYNSNDWTIYMGHTDEEGFSGSSSWIPHAELIEVFRGEINIPEAEGWVIIELDAPFVYNNTQNLVIAVDENMPGYTNNVSFFYTTPTPGANRSITYFNDSLNPNPADPPSGTIKAAYPNVLVEFGELPDYPIFIYTPENMDFGTLTQNRPSKWQNVIVSNIGGTVLQLKADDIEIFGDNTDMFEYDTSRLPVLLMPGRSVSIPVRATLSAEGEKAATLRINHDGEEYDVALSALGLPADVVLIGYGDDTAPGMPIFPAYAYNYSQSIYLQSEIDVPNQVIETISYYWNGLSNAVNSKDWTVYMGHTDLNVFPNANSWLSMTELLPVFSGEVELPAVAGWIDIPLTYPFRYNNVQNLIIAVEENTPGASSGNFINTTTQGHRGLRLQNSSDPIDPNLPTSGSMITGFANLKIQHGDLPATPIFGYYPDNLDFGVLPQNMSGQWMQVKVFNAGSSEILLDATSISITGANASMFEYSAQYLPVSLATGQSVYIPVRARPSIEGDITATLQISYGGEIYEVALSAAGLPMGFVTVGNGTEESHFPFYAYYAVRNQILYMADELNAAGAFANGGINTLAFDVIENDDMPLENFMIRMKHTNATSLSDFEYDNLETYFSDDALFESAGWHTFELTQPFTWNGSQNILIDISFTNSEMGSYTTVNSLDIPGKMVVNLVEEGEGHNLTGGLDYPYRPNARFTFVMPDDGPAVAPLLTYPANGATGLPISGFNLTWEPDLINGGLPDYYVIFISQDEDALFDEYFETTNNFYNPVTDGGLTLENNQQWYWAVEAQNEFGGDVSAVYRFSTISVPPQIAVNPGSLDETLAFGDTSTQIVTITNDGGLPLHFTIRGVETENRTAFTPTIKAIPENPEAALYSEGYPHGTFNTRSAFSRAYLDLQFVYPNAVTSGEYGAVSDGQHIYTSKWNGTSSQQINKYTLTGEYLGSFSIPGFAGVRDMTFDGTYFYGATNSTTVYVMDFATHSLVRTISIPSAARGIAYDDDEKGLWITNEWFGPLRLVDLDGNLIRTLVTEAGGMAGIAYDVYSGSGNLWANTQYGDYRLELMQIDKETGEILSTVNITPDIVPGVTEASQAGGMDIVAGPVPGTATILVNSQNDLMFGLELCPVLTWAKASPRTGEVPVGDSMELTVDFSAVNLPIGTHNAEFIITHNAESGVLNLPVSLTVTGEWPPHYSIMPQSWDFGDVELLNPSPKEFIIQNNGGPYLTLNETDIYIDGDVEGNFQIQADLPVQLSFNQKLHLNVIFTPQSQGNKTATLKVQDNLGRTIHSYPLSGNGIEESILQVVNLQARVQDLTDVLLTWGVASAEPGTPGWLHYESGVNGGRVGLGAVGDFDVAMKFTSYDLWNYAGMQIEKIKFYRGTGEADFTLRIWKGNDFDIAPDFLVYSQPVGNIAQSSWHEIVLDVPFTIVQGDALWIGYNCDAQDIEAYPAGRDNGPAVAGKGDILFANGEWGSLALDYGHDYNWNLQAYVNEGSRISSQGNWLNIPVVKSVNDKAERKHIRIMDQPNTDNSQRALRGFKVFRDGFQINSELVPTATYLDRNLADGTYTYTVQAVYYGQDSALSDPATVTVEAPAPHSLPFIEDWSEASMDSNYWVATGANWRINESSGNPVPSLQFFYAPSVTDYFLPLTSYLIDGRGVDNLELSFDLYLDNYNSEYENVLYAEVWDGGQWQYLGGHSSTITGNLPWTRFTYDITPHAANRIFRIRFVAAGEDSYQINYWYLDNIKVNSFSTTASPVTDLTLEKTANGVKLSWTESPEADWYMVYVADDPYGEYEALGYVHKTDKIVLPDNLLNPDKQFFKITAGLGSLPQTRGLINLLTK